MDQFRDTQTSNEARYFGKAKRYQILQEIGAGGMGRVYKAFDAKINRVIALKVLLSGKNANETENRRFLREAKTLASLQHKNIIRVYDIDVFEKQYFFTMDYIDGTTLKEAAKKLKKNQIIDIMIQVINAIHYAHGQGVIHRDIKPSNILVTQNNEPVVMDFGLARATDCSTLTQSGSMLGTLLYASPEQISGKKVDHLTDIYALGATLYEVLAQRPIFKSEGQANLLFLVLNKPPQPMPRTIAKELQDICFCALQKDKAKRYSSAAKMARDLRNFRKGLAVRNTGRVKIKRKKFPISYIVAVSVVVILVTSFLFLRQTSKPRNVGKKKTTQKHDPQKILEEQNRKKAQHHFAESKKQHHLYRIEKAWLEIKETIRWDKNPRYYVYGYRIFWLIIRNRFMPEKQEKELLRQADRDIATFLRRKGYIQPLLAATDDDALYCQGLMYYRGLGVEKNLPLAYEKLHALHRKGFFEATLQLVNYYTLTNQMQKLQECYELGEEKQFAPLIISYANRSKKRYLYVKAAELGYREAMCMLGYFHSLPGSPDLHLQKSLGYYLQAEKLGSYRALRGIVDTYNFYQQNAVQVPHSLQYWIKKRDRKQQELMRIQLQDLFDIK
ncbi:serine/threonine-protein kinase [Candidatus Uabimicrobium amorphum]|uniref:non-specific serine/threonine protein kinase n=1 Tax=Uabimicrobium amorphum TaxID=2596890 RepID=A0A5S9IJ38_UABAM|nr:serine/threonine-protein kinase [Candidatus Uabimicrobium amorphum]BBM82644.1 serine/threonine protein kinase [Candidatus Uabimicrobium amorphum]